MLGFLIGSGIGALVGWIIGEAALEAWGWRIPFLLGALIAVAGILFRRQMTESPVCEDMVRVAGSPVIAALRHHWRPILKMISLILVNAIGFYMLFVYAVSYLTEQMHVSTARALDINTASAPGLCGRSRRSRRRCRTASAESRCCTSSRSAP